MTSWTLHQLLPLLSESASWIGDFALAENAAARLRADSARFDHKLGEAWAFTVDQLISRWRYKTPGVIERLIAAAESIEVASGLRCDLKWPNDIVIGRPWRKLGGVLCESSERAVVIGIGLNLRAAAYPPDIADRVTAIEVELGREIDSAALSGALMRSLQAALAQLRAGAHDQICDAWRSRARSGLDGRAVRWGQEGSEHRGRARDIDADGALLVEAEGRIVRVIAGEVTWEPWTRE